MNKPNVNPDLDKKNRSDFWTFQWPVMNVLIGGFSSIDLPEPFVKDRQAAEKFISSYGYDPNNPDDARLIHRSIIEAFNFIEHHLMPAEWQRGITPPDEVLLCSDITNLLLWASDRAPEVSQKRIWSCAVLRVLHTIAHIEGVFSFASVDKARDEIFSQYQKYLFRDDQGRLRLGTKDQSVEIERIDWKTRKQRDSVLLKLLHKRANVAENIYDMLGIRIVTKKFCDVIPAVKILYQNHIISYPNAIPSRSRNTLIDLDLFRARVDTLRGEFQTGKIDQKTFESRLEALHVPPPEGDKDNPHSDQDYQAIQLTCRQLVRTPSPISRLREKILKLTSSPGTSAKTAAILEEFASSLKDLSDISEEEETSFFPYELQISDSKSYTKNTMGKASHGRYKRSQLRAARRRILNEILPLQT